MSERSTDKNFAPGETILRENMPGESAYIVLSGKVEISKIIEGQRVVLIRMGPGHIFGEMALIDSKPRMAAARASKGSTIIVVTRAMFEQKLNKTDPFIKGLLNILVDNIRSLTK